MQGTHKILVVDDEAMIRGLMRSILESRGFVVLDAANGQQAVNIFREHQDSIALVITDMLMPGLQGREVASLVVGIRPGVPIILMSGSGGPPPTDYPFLAKPFSPDQLVQCVTRLIQQERAVWQGASP